MIPHLIKNEQEFTDRCPCAYRILEFVDSIKDTDARWFFDLCYYDYFEQRFSVIFKSYITEEYKDYVLSVAAKKTEDGNYDIRIIKKVDNLLNDNE